MTEGETNTNPGDSDRHGAPIDVGPRITSAITAVYALAERIDCKLAQLTPIYEHIELGRFRRNFQASNSLMPQVAGMLMLDSADLGFDDGTESWPQLTGYVMLLVSPRGDLCLVMHYAAPAEYGATEISRLTAAGCFSRDTMRINGTNLLEWVASQVPYGDSHIPGLTFERDVHQIVFPGAALLTAILQASEQPESWKESVTLGTLISRGTIPRGLAAPRAPTWLNNPGTTLGVHGRGVSVLAGWSTHTENALTVVPPLVILASGVLKRTRASAFDALVAAESADPTTPGESRELIKSLSSTLNDMQLDLSFGVESYVDSVLVPELLIESFQVSLGAATSLPEGLSNTSRILERVTSVMQAKEFDLESAVAERRERRIRTISNVVAAGSLLALPPALLLAYFGINGSDVDSTASIFDLRRYWPVYVIAFVPFTALILVAYFRLSRRTAPNA